MKFSTSDLTKSVERLIMFPKDNFLGYLFRYGSALALSVIALYFSLLFKSEVGETLSFLIFILASLLSIYVGGVKAGFITVLFGIVSIYIFIYHTVINEFFLLEYFLYITSNLLIGFLLEKAKKTNLVSEFNKKEKNYFTQIRKLGEEKDKAVNEIKIRDEFLSIASHELKTPLTTMLLKIQGALHSIKNQSLASFSVQNLLDMLLDTEQQTQRLSKMINDFLNVSVISTGRLELEIEEADLTEIVRGIINNFKEKTLKEGYKINLDAKEKVKANIDKIRIQQVITNLISNALKYGNGKPINIKVYKHNETAEIAIEDQGIGIPSKEQEKIFALFQRAVTNGHYKGLGIGLYISNQIIKSHKGKIKVKSHEGKGSTFTIELPLKR